MGRFCWLAAALRSAGGAIFCCTTAFYGLRSQSTIAGNSRLTRAQLLTSSARRDATFNIPLASAAPNERCPGEHPRERLLPTVGATWSVAVASFARLGDRLVDPMRAAQSAGRPAGADLTGATLQTRAPSRTRRNTRNAPHYSFPVLMDLGDDRFRSRGAHEDLSGFVAAGRRGNLSHRLSEVDVSNPRLKAISPILRPAVRIRRPLARTFCSFGDGNIWSAIVSTSSTWRVASTVPSWHRWTCAMTAGVLEMQPGSALRQHVTARGCDCNVRRIRQSERCKARGRRPAAPRVCRCRKSKTVVAVKN